jgi:hypothetical protein
MPASRFAAWLGARTYSNSSVTGVTSVTGAPNPSNSAVPEPSAVVTPSGKEGVTSVTKYDPTERQEADDIESVPPRGVLASPLDLEAFLNAEIPGFVFDTRPSRRWRRYRRDPR